MRRLASLAMMTLFLAACGAPKPPAEAPVKEAAKPAPAAPASANWPTYHGAASLDGVADVAFPDALVQAWKFDAGARVSNTPIAMGQRIFFGDGKGTIYALDMSGKLLWSKNFTLPGKEGKPPIQVYFEAPLAYFFDTLIAGSSDGLIYALSPEDGATRWTCDTGLPILGTTNAAEVKVDGKIERRLYVIDESEGALQCIDFNAGKVLWKSDEIARCDGSPSASPDYVVFGSCASALHIFSTNAPKILHEIALDQDAQVAGGVVLLGEELYSGCRSGAFIHANARTGEKVWTNTDCTGEAMTTPAVSAERIVYGANDATLYGLDRTTGKTLWKQKLGDTPASPVIARDKVLVTANGKLLLLRLADGVTVWSFTVSDAITSPAVAGALVVVGSEDGTVTAFATKAAE